jgi:hypothetical protein
MAGSICSGGLEWFKSGRAPANHTYKSTRITTDDGSNHIEKLARDMEQPDHSALGLVPDPDRVGREQQLHPAPVSLFFAGRSLLCAYQRPESLDVMS